MISSDDYLSGKFTKMVVFFVFKNKTYGLLLTKELKIYKKDYLIKVPSIPLSVYIIYEKGADNTYLITVIYEVSRIISLNL
jgi:hypothetical protein